MLFPLAGRVELRARFGHAVRQTVSRTRTPYHQPGKKATIVGSAEHIATVIAYYDAHPINEDQILHALAAKGIATAGLTETLLKDYDQDHFGGVEANDILITKAGIAEHHRVLDVCSGMG